LSNTEAALLLRINQPIPAELQQRYDLLLAKRLAETLLPDEYNELLRFTGQIEALEARRLDALAELARLRGISLRAVMSSLGISPRNLVVGHGDFEL
jgi:hypothetical protein